MDTNWLPPTPPRSEASAAPKSSSPVPSTPAFEEVRDESALSPLREIFFGPNGLYPAARWLIYLAMGFVLLMLFNSIVHSIHPRAGGPVWWEMVNEAGLMLAAILPGAVMARIEGHPFADFGLPARGAFGRNFWVGALWGIASVTVLMLVLRLSGVFTFGSLDLRGARILKFAVYYAVFFLITALFEDFLWRGYSQWVLAKSMNFWPTAALLSVSFGAIHAGNAGESRVGLVAIVAIGFFFCLTLRRTGNLWWVVGFHMAWDWSESFLYSVPDSGTVAPGHLLNSSLHGPAWLTGGSVGPEGSYLVFALIVALWVVFDRVYPGVRS